MLVLHQGSVCRKILGLIAFQAQCPFRVLNWCANNLAHSGRPVVRVLHKEIWSLSKETPTRTHTHTYRHSTSAGTTTFISVSDHKHSTTMSITVQKCCLSTSCNESSGTTKTPTEPLGIQEEATPDAPGSRFSLQYSNPLCTAPKQHMCTVLVIWKTDSLNAACF